MAKICGLEPNLCIENPNFIIDSQNDIILPLYLHTQLEYIKNRQFGHATNAAYQILDCLTVQEQYNLLIFHNNLGKKIIFLDQEVAFKFVDDIKNLDITVPVNRYLVTLFLFAGLLKSKVEFLGLSPEILQKCQRLKFEIVNSDSFLTPSESWLEPQLIKNVQIRLDPLGQIQWKEDANVNSSQIEPIQWINFG